MKCSLCNCVEFDARRHTPEVCVCGHHVTTHMETNGMDDAIESSIKELGNLKMRMKIQLDHMEQELDRLKKLLDISD